MNPQRRARVLFNFKNLVETHANELGNFCREEHGKVIADSLGDIQRGLDVIEFACGVPHLLKGEYTPGAGPGIDVYSMHTASGCGRWYYTINFPAMIPMWMFGVAIATGCTFVLKPSEKDPGVPMWLAELMMEAGAPAGVLNVVNGDKEAVDAIINHPDIRAVSFVGSSDIAHYVYWAARSRASEYKPWEAPRITASFCRTPTCSSQFATSPGQPMALRVNAAWRLTVVAVGNETGDRFVEAMTDELGKLNVGISTDSAADYGPVVTAAHKQRIEDYIQMGVDEGAKLVVDGRNHCRAMKRLYVGPTLFDEVKPTMQSYQDEIFGPVLQVLREDSFEGALELPSKHQYGNGVAIFTRSGGAAREFAQRVNVGMVGINANPRTRRLS